MTADKFAEYMDDIVESFTHIDELCGVLNVSETVLDGDMEIPLLMLEDEFEDFRENSFIFQAVNCKRNGEPLILYDDEHRIFSFDTWEELYNILIDTKQEHEKELEEKEE